MDTEIDSKPFQLSQLPVPLSGLGLRDSEFVSACCFVASNAEFYSENQILYEQAQAQDPPLLCLQQIITSMEVLKQRDPDLTFDSIIAKFKDSEGSYKTQHQLSSLAVNTNRDAVVNQFNEKEKIIINSFYDEDSGRWINMAPKSDWLYFSNQEFTSAMRYRMMLPKKELFMEPLVDALPIENFRLTIMAYISQLVVI